MAECQTEMPDFQPNEHISESGTCFRESGSDESDPVPREPNDPNDPTPPEFNDPFNSTPHENEDSIMDPEAARRCKITISNRMANVIQYGDPIFKYVALGEFENLEQCIKDGTSVDFQSEDGLTPLFVACFMGDEQMAEKLLDLGADVNHQDNSGFTPLMILLV